MLIIPTISRNPGQSFLVHDCHLKFTHVQTVFIQMGMKACLSCYMMYRLTLATGCFELTFERTSFSFFNDQNLDYSISCHNLQSTVHIKKKSLFSFSSIISRTHSKKCVIRVSLYCRNPIEGVSKNLHSAELD